MFCEDNEKLFMVVTFKAQHQGEKIGSTEYNLTHALHFKLK